MGSLSITRLLVVLVCSLGSLTMAAINSGLLEQELSSDSAADTSSRHLSRASVGSGRGNLGLSNLIARPANTSVDFPDVAPPSRALLTFLANMLEEQASSEMHRSILEAIHSDVESKDKEVLLKLEEDRKEKHGSSSLQIIDGKSYYSMGVNTPLVPYEMYKKHRERFIEAVSNSEAYANVDWFFFEGAQEQIFLKTENELDFRQESQFLWLFGVATPGVSAVINRKSGKSILFVPKSSEQSKVWTAHEHPLKWYEQKYEVDEAAMEEDILKILQSGDVTKPHVVYDDTPFRSKGLNFLKREDTQGQNQSESERVHPLKKYEDQLELQFSPELKHVLDKIRGIKDPWEIQIMQYVNDVSSEAHVATMYQSATGMLRGGVARMEYAAEGLFRYISFMRGCNKVAYQASCPAGSDIQLIHFGQFGFEPQAKQVEQNELRLQDMAAQYAGYTTDVALVFPPSGKFTKEQKDIYNIVLRSTLAAEVAARPGASFEELGDLSDRAMISGLLDLGILRGELEPLMMTGIARFFMPHGLGHHLGVDVHEPGHGPTFVPGNIITIEPSILFTKKADELLDASQPLHKNVNAEKYKIYKEAVGGARLEDVLLITEKGNRMMTRLPRRVKDIEYIVSGGRWNPREQPILEFPSDPPFDIEKFIESSSVPSVEEELGDSREPDFLEKLKNFFGAKWDGILKFFGFR
eukprot:TRINITY_DN72502_c0_g1_i1.p1 TRINITY_DN72502_c0_g1~~TRINITY_DN72502_c0_g1_i1.p1  ORF type:complete len:717 (-),score=109.83 TRINITY_DN72502_c0_g1_i1:72-2156(-)